jgi:hypothetical protein
MQREQGFCVYRGAETCELAGFSEAQRRKNLGKPVEIAYFGIKT